VDLEKHRRKRWTVPFHDDSAIICLRADPDASLYEVEGDSIYHTLTSKQEPEGRVEAEEPLQQLSVIEGKCIHDIDPIFF
jgi:hypothetical protein